MIESRKRHLVRLIDEDTITRLGNARHEVRRPLDDGVVAGKASSGFALDVSDGDKMALLRYERSNPTTTSFPPTAAGCVD